MKAEKGGKFKTCLSFLLYINRCLCCIACIVYFSIACIGYWDSGTLEISTCKQITIVPACISMYHVPPLPTCSAPYSASQVLICMPLFYVLLPTRDYCTHLFLRFARFFLLCYLNLYLYVSASYSAVRYFKVCRAFSTCCYVLGFTYTPSRDPNPNFNPIVTSVIYPLLPTCSIVCFNYMLICNTYFMHCFLQVVTV